MAKQTKAAKKKEDKEKEMKKLMAKKPVKGTYNWMKGTKDKHGR